MQLNTKQVELLKDVISYLEYGEESHYHECLGDTSYTDDEDEPALTDHIYYKTMQLKEGLGL
jgi:hypothetical protein